MILVTGATGNVGRHVLAALTAAGHPVRALSRDPSAVVWPAEAEVVTGDLQDPAALAAALAGVEAVFLFAAPGTGPGFVAAAEAAGVRRVVLLSSGAVRDGVEPGGPIAAYHFAIEEALRAGGLDWTFLRPGGFAANILTWAGQTRQGDVVRGAYAGATSAPIHEADIAEAAVAALTGTGHTGRVYRLTGPESLTFTDAARVLGEVLDRPIRYEEVPAEAVREMMSAHMPAPIVESLLRVWAESVGRPAEVTDEVEKLTGHPARGFAEWVRDHAAAF